MWTGERAEGSAEREALCIPTYEPEVQQELPGIREVCPWYCTNQKQTSKPQKAIAVYDHSQWAASHEAVSSSHTAQQLPLSFQPSLISVSGSRVKNAGQGMMSAQAELRQRSVSRSRELLRSPDNNPLASPVPSCFLMTVYTMGRSLSQLLSLWKNTLGVKSSTQGHSEVGLSLAHTSLSMAR